MTRLVVPLLVAQVAGCAAPRPAAAPLPEAPLAAAGARCHGAVCSCRPVDNYGRPAPTEATLNDEGAIAPGHKRFELRTGRGFDRTTITIEGSGTVVKDVSTPEASCGYVDLAPGKYRVRLRAEAKDKGQGIQPRLVIAEYGADTQDWYDTFSFACGGEAQRCLKDDVGEWFGKARTVARGIYDKCGSARIEGLDWHVEHSPEQTLEDLTLDLVLHVYKFPPRFKHGTPTCKGLAGGRAAEEEGAASHGE